MIQFREAKRNDFEEFNKLFVSMNYLGDSISSNIPLNLEKFCKYIDSESIILMENGTDDFFGFAIVSAYDDESCKIQEIYVKEQKKGYGKEFLAYIEKLAKEIGMKQIELVSANIETDRVWEKLGFKSEGGDTYIKTLS